MGQEHDQVSSDGAGGGDRAGGATGERRQERRVEQRGIGGINDRGGGNDRRGASGTKCQEDGNGGGIQDSGAGEFSGDTAADRSDTGKATSVAAVKAGAGDHHGERSGVRERISGRRKTRPASPQELGVRREATRPPELPVNPWERKARRGDVRPIE